MSSTRNVHVLILEINCVSFILAQICPYVDKNCICTGTSVECGNLETIPPLQTGSGVIAVDKLKFNRGYLKSIPNNSLPPGLVKIEIDSNPISEISDKAFLASANTLNTLYISDTMLERLPDALLKLNNLTDLAIIDTRVQDWNDDAIQHIVNSLRYLYLFNVSLTQWPNWLSLAHSLNTLSLAIDRTYSVPDNAFEFITYTLQDLTFYSCNLTQVMTALSTLRNLTSLSFVDVTTPDVNGRPAIEQLVSYPCANTLVSLDVAMDLTAIPDLSKFRNVDSLSLSLNYITEINYNLFPPNLTHLDLSVNQITEITDASFKNASGLRSLSLYMNPISIISGSAFQHLVSLTDLTLLGTQLTQIPISLTQLHSIRVLNLDLISSLECHCPVLPELEQWYKSFNGGLAVSGFCNSDQDVASYLSGLCLTTTFKPTTTTTSGVSSSIILKELCHVLCFIIFVFTMFVFKMN